MHCVRDAVSVRRGSTGIGPPVVISTVALAFALLLPVIRSRREVDHSEPLDRTSIGDESQLRFLAPGLAASRPAGAGWGSLALLRPFAHADGDRGEPSKPIAHADRRIEGWVVRVDERLLRPPHQALGARALKFLEAKLADINAVVPAGPLEKLHDVRILLDLEHGGLHSMQYHPSAEWLKEHGYAPDLAKCAHIPVAADLVTSRNINEQPWCVLHELAHAYHDQVLGFDDPRIEAAYERFRKSGHGDRALLFDGSRVRHYGLTDPKEFFAEMTEAYFGVNDFFPFNRAELMTAEPEIHRLLASIWGPIGGKRAR